jgi:hypothetical protein
VPHCGVGKDQYRISIDGVRYLAQRFLSLARPVPGAGFFMSAISNVEKGGNVVGRKPGTPKTGGRLAGTPNKRSLQHIIQAESKGMLPHEFLAAVARGEEVNGITPTFEQQLDAAKACAPYYAPRLSSSDVTTRRVTSITELDDTELAALAGEAGITDAEESASGNGVLQ